MYVGDCYIVDERSGRCTSIAAGFTISKISSGFARSARRTARYIVQPEVLFPRQLAQDVGGGCPKPPDHGLRLMGQAAAVRRVGGTRKFLSGFQATCRSEDRQIWTQTRALIDTAVTLLGQAPHLPEHTREGLIADLYAYRREYWLKTGPLARIGLPENVVLPLRDIQARVRRRAANLLRRQSRRAARVMIGPRVSSILMTCPLDAGVGGVQVVFRDLFRLAPAEWPPRLARVSCTVAGCGLGHTAQFMGPAATDCPMPAIVRDSVVLSVPLFVAYLPISLFHLVRLMRRKQIDVINCHYLSPHFIHLVMAGRLLRVPVVVSVHGADIDTYPNAGKVYRLLCRLVMRGATRIVACSQALAKRTSEVFPDARRKVTYVHNGLDLSHYGEQSGAHPLPQPFLLCVCRHVEKKGIDTLLRCFALIRRSAPEISLVLVGDGPLLETHKALARTLGIEDGVLFMGKWVHGEVSALFSACTLFVLPSRDEPFGLVILEAAYYKKGIVCTRVGGVPEIIADGVNGLLVAPDNPEEWRQPF